MTSSALPDIDAPFFRQLVEQAAEGVWVIDADDITRYANPRMATILGTTVAQMLGRSMYDFVDPADRPLAAANLAKRREGLHDTHVFPFRRPDGGLVHTEMTAWPIFDRAGHYAGAVAFAIDVTPRVGAEAKCAESDQVDHDMFDLSHAVKLMIDPEDGHIVAANAAACTYYGYDPATFSTLNICDINQLDRDTILANMALAMRGVRNFFRFRHRLSNGDVRDVEVHATPIQRNGRVLLHALIHDIGWQTDAERRLRMTQFTIDQASLAVVWLRQDGVVRYANRAAAALAGLDLEALIGQQIWTIADLLDEAGWQTIWAQGVRDGSIILPAQRWSPRQHAPLLEVEGHMLAFDGENHMILYVRDVTHRVRAERLLKLQHDVLAEIASASPLPRILDLLVRGIEAISPELLCSILYVDEAGRLRDAAGPSLPADYRRAIDGVQIGDHVGSCGTAAFLAQPVEVSDIATDPRWANFKDLALAYGLRACWSTPVFSATNQVVATFALYYREARAPSPFHREIVAAAVRLAGVAIEQRTADARVHALAFYDPLTGLPNRTLLADRAHVALAQAERESQPLALLFLDLDRFKTINDSLGHAVGDRFLRVMAKRLAAALRDSDTVCRVGGDEFVLLLPECDMHGASVVAEKLIASVAQPVQLEGLTLNATASIGIAIYPEDAGDYDNLLKHADTAMYEAKEAGRNGYRFYRREMNEAATERLEIETALHQALLQGEFELHYQPQVDITTGELYGAEALLRWRHPKWGMVSPARFIPLAEASGLIVDIGAWALDEACRQMAAWRGAGLPLPAIAVNLSAVQFRQGDLPSLIERLLARHRLPSACLRLEITEGLMMGDDGNTIAIIARLEQLGLKLAVDDFGTGYSSLSYLKRFPVSELKLDQSFVRDLGDDPEDRALASAVVGIGHSLKLTVVAEGVETEAQLDFLRGKGCHIAQGYFFARPMPANAFESWLAGRA